MTTGLGAGLLGVDGVVVALFRKPNADPPLDGPTLDASVGAAVAAAAGSAGAVLLTVMFPNKLLDPDDGAGAAATGAASAETEKVPSKSPLLSVDSVDTNAGVAGELVEGAVLFIVIPPNMDSPDDTLAVEVTVGGAGGATVAATGAGTSAVVGPSKSNKLGASATTGGAAAAAAPLLLAGEETPGATPNNPKTLFAGAFTD